MLAWNQLFPSAQIRWTKTAGSVSDRFQDSSVFNETLHIAKILRTQGGRYYCKAENGLGSPAIKSIRVDVYCECITLLILIWKCINYLWLTALEKQQTLQETMGWCKSATLFGIWWTSQLFQVGKNRKEPRVNSKGITPPVVVSVGVCLLLLYPVAPANMLSLLQNGDLSASHPVENYSNKKGEGDISAVNKTDLKVLLYLWDLNDLLSCLSADRHLWPLLLWPCFHIFLAFLQRLLVGWLVSVYLEGCGQRSRNWNLSEKVAGNCGGLVELRLLLTVRALFSLCTPSPWRLPGAAEADVEMKTSQQRHGLVSRYTSGGTPQWVRYIAET